MTTTEKNFLTLNNETNLLLNSINSTINDTLQLESTVTPMLKQVHDILLIILLICVMFAMGCSVTLEQVLNHLRRPLGVIVGLMAQFIFLPFSSFCLIHALKLDALHATGLLILACSPGGVTSNIFTYLCDGDLSLSITMTSISTIVALLMMPANVFLYGRSLETDALVIPYFQMSFTLILITIPVVFGMILNWKLPKTTPYITKVGIVAGLAIVIICQSLEIYIFPDIFSGVPLRLYIADFILPVIGLALGYIIASVFCLNPKISRTIAIEIGIKNVGTALTIVSLSFPFEQLRKAWLFPFLYSFSSLGILIIATLYHRLSQVLCIKSLELKKDNNRNSFARKLLENDRTIVIIRSEDSGYTIKNATNGVRV